MPLTRSICKRTCLVCTSETSQEDEFNKDKIKNHVITADNIDTNGEIFETKSNLFLTNAKRLIGKTHITITNDDGNVISSINVSDGEDPQKRRYSRRTTNIELLNNIKLNSNKIINNPNKNSEEVLTINNLLTSQIKKKQN